MLSVRETAALLGVSREMVHHYRRGVTRDGQIVRLRAIQYCDGGSFHFYPESVERFRGRSIVRDPSRSELLEGDRRIMERLGIAPDAVSDSP